MSLRKDAYAGGIVIGVLLIVLFGVIYFFMPHNQPEMTMRLGDGVFKTWLVTGPTSKDDKTNRLALVPKLDPVNALLIKYDHNNRWPVYMKDVKEPIDIVWLDSKKEVVSIVKNAQLDAVPYKAHEPTQKARYVVELVAGTVDKKAISPGQAAMFEFKNNQGSLDQ
ncbi:MAG: DUF192 domain-containing protein [bacterium]|nr:DUF192 domain-containing protein [bacterium]